MYTFSHHRSFCFSGIMSKSAPARSQGRHKFSCVRNWNCYTLFQCSCTILYALKIFMGSRERKRERLSSFFSHSFGYTVTLHCIIYISLMANETEYFPLCLFAICLSSLVKWLFISFFLFSNEIILFLHCWGIYIYISKRMGKKERETSMYLWLPLTRAPTRHKTTT